MRVGILGDGIAGTLLTWQLARTHQDLDLTLFPGPTVGHLTASAASGGLVRGFEVDPRSRAHATAALTELLASSTLRRWSRYTETGSVYVLTNGRTAADGADELDRSVRDSVELVDGPALRARYGFEGLTAHVVGVAERRAGYVSPAHWRDAVLAELGGLGVTVAAPVSALAAGPVAACDVVVVAAGAWTAPLLAAAGFPAGGLRTKTIQYGVYPASGLLPPCFVDETSGLYGRPVPGGMLLGLPTEGWDVAPEDVRVDTGLADEVGAASTLRLPGLRLAGRPRLVAATDSYHDTPGLRLRRVGATHVYTFAGGSGGAAKTVLAASAEAAGHLVRGLRSSTTTTIGTTTGDDFRGN
ncbi:FAD-dependent oxidoreductase [Longispora sp. K20-0274]|uniref:FAD-dependent oxidoreductase n=1 Tax=Longispora sp. K20-0274 TaxID=3088255 RepID=UPI003999A97E